jgi:phage regulator Rha-like protein
MSPGLISIHNDEPRAGTFLIAKGFKREHKEVLRLVRKYETRFLRLDNKAHSTRLITQKADTGLAGRPVEEILLNEAQALFLGSLFRNTNEEVLDFKESVARKFVLMKDEISRIKSQRLNKDWQQARSFGKVSRLLETDTMREFTIYAKAQGSKSPDYYYLCITRMMYGLLFVVDGKFKSLRDVLSPLQLMTVSSTEQIISRSLKGGMNKQMFYKDIYKAVKADVETFAELHGKSEVIELQLKLAEVDSSSTRTP